MKKQRTLTSVLAVALLLAFTVRWTQAQGPGPLGDVSAQAAPVGTALTYQGRLTDSGGPVGDTFHFSVGGSGTRQAQASTLVWQTETVDNADNVGQHTSLALDVEDHPHISYHDVKNNDLRHAHYDGSAWISETVDSAGRVGTFTSLALDSDNQPHVSYCSKVYGPSGDVTFVKYAFYDGSTWISETVDSVGTGGGYTSLALDSADYPYISYYDANIGALKYACFDGSKWASETVDSGEQPGDDVGQYASLALDEHDFPHISYLDVTHHTLKYAHKDRRGWHITTVDGDGYVGAYTSLALDSAGRPHISYYDSKMGALKYAVSDGSPWETSVVDDTGNVGRYTSIAVDIEERPHISYYDDTGQDLKYASFDGSRWISETVDDAEEVGEYTSLALDSIDRPQISYYGEINGTLKYATHDLTPPTIISGPTVTSTTQATAVVAWQTDEDSDSVVQYGKHAGIYDLADQDPALVQSHQMTLTQLDPSTVYHYVVRSTDAASNTVVSGEGFFETAPLLDTEPPNVESLTFTRLEGPFQFYKVTAPVSDNVGVERVEFYLDDQLIGADYSASSPDYTCYLDPAGMGMTADGFFTSHEIRAAAFDRYGLQGVFEKTITPMAEPLNGELQILSPPPNYALYFDGPVVPDGTFLGIQVHATEYEWDCTPPGWLAAAYLGTTGQVSVLDGNDDSSWYAAKVDPIWCHNVERALSGVEFYIDIDRDGTAELVHTWIPSSDDELIHTYQWDVGGLSPGDYYMVVNGYLSDGREAYDNRTIEITGEGIDVQREVVKYGNFFQVSLSIVNEGSVSIQLDKIEDNLTSFQAIGREQDDFEVSTHYSIWTQRCDVDIDFFSDGSDTITLAPGVTHTASYLAVPVFHAPQMAYHAIGENEVHVHYIDHSGSVVEDFLRPDNWLLDNTTLDWETLGLAVYEAQSASDYLIITNPLFLFMEYNADNVDELLSKMAELSRWKDGVLGYVCSDDANYIDSVIGQWGSNMKGSNGNPGDYLDNGYLLIVGETEIIPSGSKKMNGKSYLRGEHKPLIHYTDMYYANTSGNSFNPEIIVGRIIGNDAVSLTIPIQTSIDVRQGSYFFDRSHALTMMGWPETRDGGSDYIDFGSEACAVAERLANDGTDITGFDTTRFVSSTVSVNHFLDLAPDRDIIHLAGHGNPYGCDDLSVSDFATRTEPFGSARPFVFGSSCSTGRYPAGKSLAEAFLQHGAGVYIGSTEVSYCCTNKDVAKKFYSYWDPGKAIGAALRGVKRDIGSYDWQHPAEGYYEDIWTAEYQLYGDPKYGEGVFVSTSAGSSAFGVVRTSSEVPPASLDVVVPDYEITTTVEGETFVDIPGGSTVLMPDKPLVPLYDVSLEYPPGYRVQEVILTERSGLTHTTGLNIPNFSPAVAGDRGCGCGRAWSATSEAANPEWWPDEDFDWRIEESPSGTCTLMIRMYPFFYNPRTTGARFYKNYSFDIHYITSTVEVDALVTDKDVYPQGDDVSIDLWLNNSGDAQDVIVDAIVKRASSGEVVDGLPLHSLGDLTGLASFSYQWSSIGFEPGYYLIEAEVRDSDGNVLDRAMEEFRLGVYAGEITAFTATPELFDIGDTIDISMVFSNTGTVPITGTAMIAVQSSDGLTTTAKFTHTIANLAPAEAAILDDGWDTSGAEEGSYRCLGYVLYDSKATSPRTVVISTEACIYLPLVVRNS